MNLPNALSLLRIFLAAPFLIAVIYGRYGVSLAIFIVAAATDFLDGFFARRLEQKSLLGTYLDPLGDKLLVAVAFVSLAAAGLLPAWLAVIVIAKDLYVSLGSAILYFTGDRTTPVPSVWGKQTTALQLLAAGLALLASLPPSPPLPSPPLPDPSRPFRPVRPGHRPLRPALHLVGGEGFSRRSAGRRRLSFPWHAALCYNEIIGGRGHGNVPAGHLRLAPHRRELLSADRPHIPAGVDGVDRHLRAR